MKDNQTLPIAEVFYSIQGEGITMGIPSVFLRLAGCNLMCGGQGTQFDKELHNGAKWRCDTIEVWMKGAATKYDDIFTPEQIRYLRFGAHLVITGGEPLLNQEKIIDLIKWLKEDHQLTDLYVEIETNGTIKPIQGMIDQVDQWNCSPKLSNSGNDKPVRFNREVLEMLNRLDTQFKFVINEKSDFDEMLKDFAFIDSNKIVLMPAGESQELLEISRKAVAQLCIEYCLIYSDRLHIVIWNQKTGV